jgi:hypothetical protein
MNTLEAQNSGIYVGTVNGDIVTITLNQSGSSVNGSMKDSQQNYELNGSLVGNQFNATAVESNLGLKFYLTGNLQGDNLSMNAQLDLFGTMTPAFNTIFQKQNFNAQGSQHQELPTSPQVIQNANAEVTAILKNKNIDPYLIGNWREESHYSSGYGSDFSGVTYTYTSFNSDYTMSDRGSKATISGSNYSGQSGGSYNGNVIPNLWYYTEGNQIMAVVNNNGKIIQVPLGKYHIENGKMLFIQANTQKKILYYRE